MFISSEFPRCQWPYCGCVFCRDERALVAMTETEPEERCQYYITRNRPVSAAMTKSELGVASEKTPTTFLVDWDSARRRARRLAVQSDVGELCFISRSVRS